MDPVDALIGQLVGKLEREMQEIKQFVYSLKNAFADYLYDLNPKQMQENVRVGQEVLDIYFQGRGYIFVPSADANTVQRALRMAQGISIVIVAYYATDAVMQQVKHTRGLDIYNLSQMTKTTGILGVNHFDFYSVTVGKSFTKI
jgi:hypothetical protein